MPSPTLFGGASFPPGTVLPANGGSSPLIPPLGFDAVLQFSNRMLNESLNYNLQQDNLDVLSARVPYDPRQVTPKLRSLIAPYYPVHDLSVLVNLEVVLLAPAVTNLYAPPPSGGVMARKSKRSTRRAVATPQASADLNWVLQVNLFETNVAGTTGGPMFSRRAPAPEMPGTGTIAGGNSTAASGNAPAGLPEGTRIKLAGGTAVMHGVMTVALWPEFLQFSTQLNCQGLQPEYQSTNDALSEFLGSPLAKSMLAQAVAPLLNGYLVRISPTVALAGNLNSAQIAQLQLPAFNVSQQVVQDPNGLILTHCVRLRQDAPEGSVNAFLAGHDFSYYVGGSIFGPVLAALWQANAIRVPIIANVPVEMPVSGDSSQTGQGIAQIQVLLSDTLTQSTIQASDTVLGDPLQLVSEQTVQLLQLWDPQGNKVSDLGDLGKPATEPCVMNLQLFDIMPPGGKQDLNPLVQNLIAALMLPIYLPILRKLTVNSISGFTSSSLRALLVSWNLPQQATIGQIITGL